MATDERGLRMAGLMRRLRETVFPAATLKRAFAAAEAGTLQDAFIVLAKAAQNGNRRAQYWVGKAYLEGRGVPRSRASAMQWLGRAAEAGETDAQSVLAVLYLAGASKAEQHGLASVFADDGATEPDFDRAFRWARSAAEAGSADAQALLGYLLTSGPEPTRDLVEALGWYRKSATAGCGQGSLGLALALLRDAKDDEARAEAAIVMTQAADARVPLAVYVLGTMHEAAFGVPQDWGIAGKLYQQAAELGVRSGMARWGLFLLEGRGGQKDAVKGESWLRRAALAGDAEAAALVGDLYSKGGDLPPNYAEAATWYTRSAENGHGVAARALAMLYLTGAGVARDPDEAARWFRIAGERGDTESRGNLAQLVLRGSGKPEDRVRTRQWFEESARNGDLVAAFNFGVCLAEGVGVERDERQAAEWLRRAADGVANAQFWYGRMLTEGRGVDANPVEGRHWIERAAGTGMVEAQVLLAEMLVNGRGGPRDHPAAQRLFQAAAEKEHVGAQFAMGAMLGGGHEVPTDRVAAQQWFERAAAKGHAYAMLMLGRYLMRNLAGQRDMPRARAMLLSAQQAGVAEAAQDLAAIDRMTGQELPAPSLAPAHLDAPGQIVAAQ